MTSSTSTKCLTEIAEQAALEWGFLTEFSPEMQKEINEICLSFPVSFEATEDLRDKLWISIDNDDTRDIDQLTLAEENEGFFSIYVAVADVEYLIKKQSLIDDFAANNTTSIYTPTKVFPMLPERFSTNLTSLKAHTDRASVIVKVNISLEGKIKDYRIYTAWVVNQAKLTYNRVSAWLEKGESFPQLLEVPGLETQLQLQHSIARLIRHYRESQGALTLETYEYKPIIKQSHVVDMSTISMNVARELIEDYMITANISIARFLKYHKIPSLRRVVRIPKRWNRIVEIASTYGEILPKEPDPIALDLFLKKRLKADPVGFPDLSLSIIKLLGKGEYIVEDSNERSIGHFSLALPDYVHATAPNRRFSDLVIQRILKTFLNGESLPYTMAELTEIAKQCTQKENAANKVERQVKKSAAILLLEPRINEVFDGIITGSSSKGTWVRIRHPAVEGKVIKGAEGIDVGDKVKAKLVYCNLQKGFIDFVLV